MIAMLSGTTTWWVIMVVIGAANLAIAWFIFGRAIHQRDQRRVFPLVLGVVFVTVACYRTIFVSSYPDRLAWFDTMFNSPLVIRGLALCAELSFIGLIAWLLRSMPPIENATTGLASAVRVLPVVAVCCIGAAQLFSFGGLITQFNFLFAIEETLWALAFISITPVVVLRLRRRIPADAHRRAFLIIMAVWCFGYLAFQLFYALPFMYYTHLADGLRTIVFSDALHQSFFNFTATHNYTTWGGIGFFIWQSGYFSICSWIMLYAMTVPVQRVGHNEMLVSEATRGPAYP